jgi:hypothetical protein
MVKFPSEQPQICNFWLLLTVKSNLTSMPIFLFEVLLVDWVWPLATVFHWHAWSSVYNCGCSIRKVMLIRRTNLKFWFSFNSYAHMHGEVTYHQTLYMLEFSIKPLHQAAPWWQSSSLITPVESRRTCIFYEDVGLSSLNPILISLVRNHVNLLLERALPMLFASMVHFCSIH